MQGQLYVPPLSKINKIILIVIASSFVVQTIFGLIFKINLASILGLSSTAFIGGHIYQMVTYPLMGSSILEIVFDGLLLWFIGSDLEAMWGTKRYLKFLLISILGGALLFLTLSFLLYDRPIYIFTGLTGFTNSLLMAYAIIYPHRHFSFMFIFPVKAWICCVLIIVMQFFSGLTSSAGVLHFGHLGAMASGYLYMVLVSSPKWKALMAQREVKRKKSKSSHLKLVKDDDDKPPKYWQ